MVRPKINVTSLVLEEPSKRTLKVILVGNTGTGKTTAANGLAKHFSMARDTESTFDLTIWRAQLGPSGDKTTLIVVDNLTSDQITDEMRDSTPTLVIGIMLPSHTPCALSDTDWIIVNSITENELVDSVVRTVDERLEEIANPSQ